MIEPEEKEAIEFRLKEAEESLQDGLSLFKNARYRSAVNRAYYSMVYSALNLDIKWCYDHCQKNS